MAFNPSGLYIVLTASDVVVTGMCGSFCGFHNWCARGSGLGVRGRFFANSFYFFPQLARELISRLAVSCPFLSFAGWACT